MKVTEPELRERTIQRLTVRSVTMSICTVEIELEGETYVLCDSQHKVMRFNGVDHARNTLSHLDVRAATLLHDSPHDEMVGLSNAGAEPIQVGLAWS